MKELESHDGITAQQTVGPEARPYWSPYLAGVGLGIVLLLSYVFMGRGLGASGAFTRLMGYGLNAVASEHAHNLGYFSQYLNAEMHVLNEWLVFLVAGVFVGGFISGALSKRIKLMIDKGPTFSANWRLWLAFFGGVISAFGARLARGCTSGQALSGGATLALSGWLFIIAAFAGGYAIAWFVRRQWK